MPNQIISEWTWNGQISPISDGWWWRNGRVSEFTFYFRSGHDQVVTTQMGDCSLTV